MARRQRLTQAVVLKRLSEAWDDVLASSFGMTHEEARRQVRELLMSSDVSRAGDLDSTGLFIATIAFTLGKTGRNAIQKNVRNIRTEADLMRAVEQIRAQSEVMPSALRKAMKTLAVTLPRRGGPGRKPKLSAEEAGRACDHIATFIRQKYSVRGALERTAELSVGLLGKKVSARTLQKAWKDRHKTAQ